MEGGSSSRRPGLAVTTASVFWVFSNVCSIKTAQYNLLTGRVQQCPLGGGAEHSAAEKQADLEPANLSSNADFAISKHDLSK